MLTVKDPKNQDWENMSLFDIAHGNAEDIYYTFKIYELLRVELEKIELTKLYDTLISPLTPIFAKMERAGLRVDTELLPKIGEELDKKVQKAKVDLYKIPEVKDYNLNSPAKKVQILYTDEDGFALYPPKRSKKTGEPSTDKKCLDELVVLIEEELESRSRKK